MAEFNTCQKAFLSKMEIVDNLMSDIEGENKAISDYRAHIEDLKNKFSAEPEARTLIKLLEEIESEERHHLAELSSYAKNTITFRMQQLFDDLAACECNIREERTIPHADREQGHVKFTTYRKK